MRKFLLAAIVPALALGAAACQVSTGGNGATSQTSGGNGQTGSAGVAVPNPAMTTPDQTAWNIFIEAVKPAGSSGTTFETWPSDAETFSPGAQPTGGKLLRAAAGLHLRPPVIPSVNPGGPAAQGGAAMHGLAVGTQPGSSGGPPNPTPPGVANPNGCDATQNPQTFEPGCDGAMQEEVRRNPSAGSGRPTRRPSRSTSRPTPSR